MRNNKLDGPPPILECFQTFPQQSRMAHVCQTPALGCGHALGSDAPQYFGAQLSDPLARQRIDEPGGFADATLKKNDVDFGELFNEDVPWGSLWSITDTYVFNRRVVIPHIPVPASNPKAIADIPVINVIGNPYPWFNRVEEWTVKA